MTNTPSLSLKGKRILLIIPTFYNYHLLIQSELQQQGAVVEMVNNEMQKEDFRCSTNYLITLVYRILNPFYKQKHTSKLIASLQGKKFDLVFAINGFSITRQLIGHLKSQNSGLISFVFFWDSFYYWKYSHLIELFDVAYSFDRKDCERFRNRGLRYHPDFYISGTMQSTTKLFDVTCIASLSEFSLNRIDVMKQISEQAGALGLKCYLRIYYPEVAVTFKGLFRMLLSRVDRFVLFKKLKKSQVPFMVHEKLSLEEVHRIENASAAILDIPPPNQNGMTIRSLEAIAAGKKLITTNQMIKEESFYRKDNILIIDPDKVYLDPHFFATENVPVDITALRLDNWVNSVLSEIA